MLTLAKVVEYRYSSLNFLVCGPTRTINFLADIDFPSCCEMVSIEHVHEFTTILISAASYTMWNLCKEQNACNLNGATSIIARATCSLFVKFLKMSF